MDDRDIVQLYLFRDERAVSETDAAYGKRLFRLAMRILDNYEDSEECRNDTYIKAWKTIPPAIPEFLYAYLAKICRNLAFNMLDYQAAKKRNVQIVELTREMEQCIPDYSCDFNFSEDELGEIFSDFLMTQPKDARMIFVRRYWYGEATRMIAVHYGISDAAVRKSLQRTRDKLKLYLKKKGVGL